MRPNAGVYHADFIYNADVERAARLQATRAASAEARLRSVSRCVGCQAPFYSYDTEPGLLAVPLLCAACQPTATENNT